MQILDMTNLRSRTLPGTAKPAAEKVIEHYSTFWSGENFEPAPIAEIELATRRWLILRHLAAAEAKLKESGFQAEHLHAALLIGNGSANGHAFLDSDGLIAWFAIECYESELEAKVFVMHELIHALHYATRPEFAFETIEQKNLISRQLITEGIATYLTKRLWNLSDEKALWADTLPDAQLRSWMMACRNSERELFEFVTNNFDSSDSAIELFHASKPDNIFSFRAGYYVGLKVVEALCREHAFEDIELLTIPFHEMGEPVLETLTDWSYI